MKTFERAIVERIVGHWPSTDSPTNGYLMHALRAIDVDARGMTRPEMIRRANENGLDFIETPQQPDKEESPR